MRGAAPAGAVPAHQKSQLKIEKRANRLQVAATMLSSPWTWQRLLLASCSQAAACGVCLWH